MHQVGGLPNEGIVHYAQLLLLFIVLSLFIFNNQIP
jgi:hypothetical protein